MNIKQIVKRNLLNIPGWRTNRKIVVIESDDWGSIRMPSREVYEQLLKKGYRVDLNPYEKYDSLESEEDLNCLFEVLTSFKDKNGNHPKITANCVVANPDFKKIRASEFKEYYFESVLETFKSYPNHEKSFELWKEGLATGIFIPQFHGREHVNVSLFMKALQERNQDALFNFNLRIAGGLQLNKGHNYNLYVEATNYSTEVDKKEKLSYYLEGLGIFEELFGYKSKSIIPTNYTWSRDFNKELSELGVLYQQGNRNQREPVVEGNFKYNSHKLGEMNEYGQFYLIRNCLFEPSLSQNFFADTCLSNVKNAFCWQKPAIISSHRLNYIGGIDKRNQMRNLIQFKDVLRLIITKWPDVEFMSSDQLGDIIKSERN